MCADPYDLLGIAGAPIGMYEGVGPCQAVRAGFVGALIVLRACEVNATVVAADLGVGCRTQPSVAGCSHQRDPRRVRVPWGGQARLPRHVFASGFAHDGIVGHGQVGLNQFFDRTRCAWWVMPIVEFAAWSCPSLTRPSRPARGIGSRRRAGRSRRA